MMNGTATKTEVNGLEDDAWTPMNGLPMDDDADMNGTDEFITDDDDDVSGTDIVQE
jgi:hypothetical protein